MKKLSLILAYLVIFNVIFAQTAELKEAFDYLNQVRANPAAFSEEIGIDLSSVQSQKALTWNEILAKVAQEKAKDMATRDYFSHTNPEGNGINILIFNAGYEIPKKWTIPASNNYFESITWGKKTPKDAIVSLIYDKGKDDANAGHRKHLLGITSFYKNLTDIGIGHFQSPNNKNKFYISVIIAKHSY